uniref:Uncharacterized protein n=1 Tax=Catharus ustulatus TaxID=91951 RepID=A0A8C3TST3_CATUS
MPTPGGVDVSHGSEGRLHPARHLFQEHIKVGHFLLVDDDAAPREERVPVAIHQHALHGRLREPGRLGAGTAHAGAGSARPAAARPYRPAFLGKPPRVCPASPREPARSLPGPEAPRAGARGPACPEGAAGAEGTGSQAGREGDPRSFSSSCSH